MANSIEILVKTGRGIEAVARMSEASQVVREVEYRTRAEQSGTLTYEGDQKIEADFRTFLDSNEMGHIFFGAAISAPAAAGQSKRFKQPYKKRAERPAFVDTGLYRSSFRAWTEE